MRRLVLAALTLASVAAFALPSGAATTSGDVHLKDAAEDANFVNSQGFVPLGQGISTAPATVKSADIKSLDIVTVYDGKGAKRHPIGISVVMKLDGDIGTGVDYGVYATVPSGCDSAKDTGIEMSWEDLAAETDALAICEAGTGTSPKIGGVTLDRPHRTLTWFLELPVKPGQTLTDIKATTSVFVEGQYDELTTPKAFTYAK